MIVYAHSVLKLLNNPADVFSLLIFMTVIKYILSPNTIDMQIVRNINAVSQKHPLSQ